ncbi:unnamed protein product [Brassica oleracea var. botrytis]
MLTQFSCPQSILSITISSTNLCCTTLTSTILSSTILFITRVVFMFSDVFWFWFEYVRGDKAVCSVECRSKQMVMDEEESFRRYNCSFMVVKATKLDSPAPMSSGGGHHRHHHLTFVRFSYI